MGRSLERRERQTPQFCTERLGFAESGAWTKFVRVAGKQSRTRQPGRGSIGKKNSKEMVAGFDFALLAKALSRVLEDLCPVGFLRGMSHRLAVLRSVRLTGLGDPQFDVDCPTPVACESQVFEHERKQHFRATLPFAAAFSGTESAPTLKGMRKKGPFLVQFLGHFLADERLIPGAPAFELLLFPGVLLLQSLQLLP